MVKILVPESRTVVASGHGRGEWEFLFNGDRVTALQDEKGYMNKWQHCTIFSWAYCRSVNFKMTKVEGCMLYVFSTITLIREVKNQAISSAGRRRDHLRWKA